MRKKRAAKQPSKPGPKPKPKRPGKPAPKPPAKPRPKRDDYARVKEEARRRRAELSETGREIGPLPAIARPKRREKAKESLAFHAKTYHPDLFALPWSPDHLTVIGKAERAIRVGGCFALAMPRGTGKTTLCEVACEWAALHGYRLFILIIGADLGHAVDMLSSIKSELAHNDLLAEDFPEVCLPIREMEGITQRCKGQLLNGKPTEIQWKDRVLVLPNVEGSAAAGVVLRAAGLTAAIRGAKHKRADGTAVRPGLVIVDDPQTDQSARSPGQCERRLRVLCGAVLNLAGPGQKIAAIMPCTVIAEGDVADQLLDRQTHPEWDGERLPAVYAFPTDEKLWDEYARIRAEGLRAGRGIEDATEFYAANREAMDAGAKVAWEERFNEDEISGLQHQMNLKLADPYAFAAEQQQRPLKDERRVAALTREEILGKQNGLARGVITAAQNVLTGFCDVHKEVLYWAALAWESDFTGAVVDWGTFPRQQVEYFTHDQVSITLEQVFARSGRVGAEGGGEEAAILWGLDQVAELLLGREWIGDGGSAHQMKILLVDANWKTRLVKQWARASKHAARILPSHGRYVGAAKKSLGEYKPARGDQVGDNWRITRAEDLPVRHCLWDTNYWKSQVATRWRAPLGERTSLSVWTGDHRMLADQMTAEYPERVEGRGRTIDEWQLVAGRDNHIFDCVVGATVAASVAGVHVPGLELRGPARKRMRFSEIQRKKWGRR
ncbi:MAG: phage terminase large subunit family protein [Phycisphaerae bacterium]|nr:phage terminase large subunit family protein [Phycisphaerae bacterium]